MNIEQELDRIWQDYHEEAFQNATQTERTFKGDNGPDMRIIHNTLRDQWEKTKATRPSVREPADLAAGEYAPLVFKGEFGKELLFKINPNPTLRHHLMIFTMDMRENPDFLDHLTIMDFVNQTEYAVYQNLRGSGAGIPHIMHYQAQKRHEFPLVNGPMRTYEIEGHTFLPEPTFGMKMEYDEPNRVRASEKLGLLHNILKGAGYSYNLLFDDYVVYIYPRRREFACRISPQLEKAGMAQWQMGGQEMGYLFTAKYRSILDNVSRYDLECALRDVTLDFVEQEWFESQMSMIK